MCHLPNPRAMNTAASGTRGRIWACTITSRRVLRTSSHDGLEAFRSLAEQIDLVLADLNMPQMTGLQLCRELRAIRPGVRVIACTGFSEQFDAARARAIGIQGFLNKPVVMAELARAVRSALDNPAA